MRKNPHVRICGGLGSATTLVYLDPITALRAAAGRVGVAIAATVFLEKPKNNGWCGAAPTTQTIHAGSTRFSPFW